MKRKICILLTVCTLLFVPACSGGRQSRQTSFIDLFDTAAVVIAYDTGEEAFAGRAAEFHSRLKEYNDLYDIYNSYEGLNNLCTVNENAGKAPVEVDRRIIDLLLFGKEMYALSQGRVNIAFGAVLKIWHDYRALGIDDPDNARLPPWEKLLEAAEHTDINDVVIDPEGGTVYLADPEMSLDVGAIAKGYAVERVCQWAKESGWDSAAVSVGGNVRTLGGKDGGAPWVIGVEDPEGGDHLFRVDAENISVVTSGDYQRYYTVEGRRYHHLIDPKTLFPAENARSVTVVTEDSGYADGLSTALFLMPQKEGQKLVESLEGVEAAWVLSNGEIVFSSGFGEYLAEREE